MSNGNVEKFTRSELADLYEKVILFHEGSNKLQGMNLSTRSKVYRELVKEIRLEVNRFETVQELANAEIPLADFSRSFIWFHDAKNNSLKSILYHLRNSAAHADIKRRKNKQVWYLIEHRYNGQLKLVSFMKKTDFWRFVDESKKSKVSKKR